jgi:hypothetical protein
VFAQPLIEHRNPNAGELGQFLNKKEQLFLQRIKDCAIDKGCRDRFGR